MNNNFDKKLDNIGYRMTQNQKDKILITKTIMEGKKRKSLLSSLEESINNGLDTLNSSLRTTRDTLELTRNVLQNAIEESKLETIKTKKKAIKAYYKLGFSVENIVNEVGLDSNIVQNVIREENLKSQD